MKKVHLALFALGTVTFAAVSAATDQAGGPGAAALGADESSAAAIDAYAVRGARVDAHLGSGVPMEGARVEHVVHVP